MTQLPSPSGLLEGGRHPARNVLSDRQPPGPPAELPRGEWHLSLHVTRYPRGPEDQTLGAFKGWVWTEAFPGHSGREKGPPSVKHGKREVCAGWEGVAGRAQGFLGTRSRPAFTCCPLARQLRETKELGGWLQPVPHPPHAPRHTPWQTNPLECGLDSGWGLWVQDPQRPNADAPRRGALVDPPLRLCLSRARFPRDGPPVLLVV